MKSNTVDAPAATATTAPYAWRVPPGDSIRQKYLVRSKPPSSKNPTRGVVELEIAIVNQKGEIIREGYDKYLIGGAA
ncbi:hypothetical protein [Ancylobacter amanitiformis]|uniref:Uncharacterized protein n=1 Tax=Ancylobacter amanitiformis TaxID=217069 RepID=A0ABU0LMV5_9HYPH|nr:hypothetical protein [Ancylobacter amanitiformis]MDQ0510038.1 hypothetical protein [Ancylobacter amanitiformis]